MDVLILNEINKARDKPLLKSVSFALGAGQGIGIRGHNGCGKTTLLDIIAGLQKQNSGSCTVNATIGYVMQKSGFQEGLSCLDNLRLEAAICGFKGNSASERVAQCAQDCRLGDFLRKKARKCSAGMRARLAIAMALIPEPGLLLLDEAFSALDDSTRLSIVNLLEQKKRRGMAIVMVSHSREDLPALCERLLELPGEEVIDL